MAYIYLQKNSKQLQSNFQSNFQKTFKKRKRKLSIFSQTLTEFNYQMKLFEGIMQGGTAKYRLEQQKNSKNISYLTCNNLDGTAKQQEQQNLEFLKILFGLVPI
jgi:hypothetical protein